MPELLCDSALLPLLRAIGVAPCKSRVVPAAGALKRKGPVIMIYRSDGATSTKRQAPLPSKISGSCTTTVTLVLRTNGLKDGRVSREYGFPEHRPSASGPAMERRDNRSERKHRQDVEDEYTVLRTTRI